MSRYVGERFRDSGTVAIGEKSCESPPESTEVFHQGCCLFLAYSRHYECRKNTFMSIVAGPLFALFSARRNRKKGKGKRGREEAKMRLQRDQRRAKGGGGKNQSSTSFLCSPLCDLFSRRKEEGEINPPLNPGKEEKRETVTLFLQW